MLKREHKVSNISSEAIFAIPAMKPSRVVIAVIFCLFLMLTDVRYESGSYLRSVSYDLIKPITLLTRIPNYLFEVSTVFFIKFNSPFLPSPIPLREACRDDSLEIIGIEDLTS